MELPNSSWVVGGIQDDIVAGLVFSVMHSSVAVR